MQKDLTPTVLADSQHVEITKEYVIDKLIRFYVLLEDATGNPLTTLDIIDKVGDGIAADPEFSKMVLTPENIAKIYALKAKSDAGTIKVTDIEQAFPIIAEKVPMWGLLKTFLK